MEQASNNNDRLVNKVSTEGFVTFPKDVSVCKWWTHNDVGHSFLVVGDSKVTNPTPSLLVPFCFVNSNILPLWYNDGQLW